METFKNTGEIVESLEEVDPGLMNKRPVSHYYSDAQKRYSIEDDINHLFQAIDNKSSCRSSGQPHVVGRDTWQKSALKRPIRVASHNVSSIGISEAVSLKQALRGLCISQAAEMAAMKRQTRPVQSLGVSETVAIKSLYRTMVVEASGSGASVTEGKGKMKMVEISLVPERITFQISNETPKVMQNSNAELFNPSDRASTSQVNSIMEEIIVTSLSSGDSLGCGILEEQVVKQQCAELLSNAHARRTDPAVDNTASSVTKISRKSSMQGKRKGGLVNSVLSHSGSSGGAQLSKSSINSLSLIKPNFPAKSFVKKKAKMELTLPSSTITANVDIDKIPMAFETESQINECSTTYERKENEKASNVSVVVKSGTADTNSTRHCLSSNCCNKTRSPLTKSDERSSSKGEFSRSLESGIVDCSSSPSISRESIVLGSSRSGNRPHMSKDLRWEAIHQVQNQNKILCLTNFKMLRRLGLGDIGTVYLAELSDTNCLFAMKVMDNEYLTSRKKMLRAQTEKEILHMLDHPFLPTLYTHFETGKFTYLVIDYCPGGDLHVLRQKQPSRNFSEQAVRFYVAEVLLALEYLHMLGVIYRDLKPENILIREDGHIMLTDFDSSLRCAVNTMVLKSSSPFVEPTKKAMSPCDDNSCIPPLCLQPSWQVPCFSPKLLSASSKSRKIRSDPVTQVNPLPQLVVEPISARSNSLVGTHEYLAPEIIKSQGHGSAVDWWTYGILLFELLYGKTPFKGSSNEETLANIVSESLRFPDTPMVSFHARDLIRCLLRKEPENRLGSVKGAAEIKQHSFFDGLNWALIRCTIPPELPKVFDEVMEPPSTDSSKKEGSNPQINESTVELEDAFGLF